MTTIIWTTEAERDLQRLGNDVELRVISAVERFALTGQGDVRTLTGYPGAFRLRIGDWRVIFHRLSGAIVVDNVLHRREAYRG